MPPTGSAPPPPPSTLSFEQRSAPSPRTSTRGSLPHVPPPPSLAPPNQPSATQSASPGTLFSFKYYNPEKSRRAGWRTAKYDDEDELPPSLPSPHVQPPSVPQHNPPTQPSATQSTSLSTVSSFWYYNSEESSRTASRSDPHDSNVALSQPPPPPLSVPQQKNTKRASTRKRTAKTKKTNPSGPEPLMQADSSPAMAELTQSQTQTQRLEPIPTPRFPVPAPVQTTQKRRRDDSDDEAGFSSSKRERVEEQSEDTTGFSVSGGDEELSAIVGLVPDTLDFIDSSASSPTVTTTPTETSAVVPVPVHEEVEPDLSASRVATLEPLESGVVSPKQTFEHSPPEIAAATAQDQEEGFLHLGSGSGSPADVADSNYNSKPAHDDHEFDWKAYWMPDLNAPRIEHDIAPDPTGESTNESDEWALPVSLTLLFNV
ncbi:hypothetical protein V5O48_011887 [Marasmius crinis-equi]|uniref:Uncharacterized protein n=1 Tax=Marasmius crinis-equi TaxID=585013 RepID=A0ABR3F4P6_9AGAR